MGKIKREELEQIRARVGEARDLTGKGCRVRVTVHTSTCGIASGAQTVLRELQRLVASCKQDDVVVATAGCLGLCSEEPLVTVERGGWEPVTYARINAEDARWLFACHVVKGEVWTERALMQGFAGADPFPNAQRQAHPGVPHVSEVPFFARQTSWVLANRGINDPDSIDEYIWRGGYRAAAKALLDMAAAEVVSEVKLSGLRGRGGGGFPTGIKWDFCASTSAEPKYVLCNADEGDPGAFMDRSVMEGDPHAVIEGMVIAARAIGSQQGYIYCRAEYPLAVERLQRAIGQARSYGLLGQGILGSETSFDMEVYQGAGAFVCGEETALMASIEGRRGTPRPRPPFPAVSGLWGKPTILNNVETYANVPRIIERGGEDYAGVGTERSKGTKVFALTGKVRNVGLVEVPMGTPLGEIVYDVGGGIPGGKKLKAVQLGGPSGGCVPVAYMSTATDYEEIIKAGAIMGSGGMIVMDEDTCMADMARYFMDFCQDESCGKCTPCRVGTKRLLEILERICHGQGQEGDLELLEELAHNIRDSALCGLGQTAPNPLLSVLRHFRSELEAHILQKRCPASACTALFLAPCENACPLGTDVPAYLAWLREGRIEEAHEVLKRTNPFPSVCGRVCHHPCESKCRRAQLDAPVAIRNLKRFIADHAEKGRTSCLPDTRVERVAVIGAGPAGLTAAWQLRKRGYRVTVFEALPEAGGMLRWGIPAYRLPRAALRREIRDIVDTGVDLRVGVRVGRDISFEQLTGDYEAVYLSVGAQGSTALGIPGEDAEGVYGAVELLRDYHLEEEVGVGRRVAVIGGGNSAVDAARVALRLGAEQVTICYRRRRQEMPAIAAEVDDAEAEGISLLELVSPTAVLTGHGKVVGLQLQRMRLGDFDSDGRRRPLPVPEQQLKLQVDTVIAAIGQQADVGFLGNGRAVAMGHKGIWTDRLGKTTHSRVWAGGDAVTGAATVVEAIAAGRLAAESIDAHLRAARGEPSWSPPPEQAPPPAVQTGEPASEAPRAVMPKLAMDERHKSFAEVELGYARDVAIQEACRCQRCDAGSRTARGAQPRAHSAPAPAPAHAQTGAGEASW